MQAARGCNHSGFTGCVAGVGRIHLFSRPKEAPRTNLQGPGLVFEALGRTDDDSSCGQVDAGRESRSRKNDGDTPGPKGVFDDLPGLIPQARVVERDALLREADERLEHVLVELLHSAKEF